MRHIVHGEREAQLRASGVAVIEDWKGHYRRYGLAADQYPKDWNPVAIWNRYHAMLDPLEREGRLRRPATSDASRGRGGRSGEICTDTTTPLFFDHWPT